MKHLIRFLLLLNLLVLGACQAKQSDQSVAADVTEMEGQAEMDQAPDADEYSERQYKDPPVPPEERTPPPPPQTAPVPRKIIRSGNVTFETDDAIATRKFLARKVEEAGGYISQDNVYHYEDKIQHQLTLRIPSDKFDFLLEQISANAKKLDQKNISAQDVTEEFIDIQARLKTKKELENRYLELLKKAQKVEEMLNIESEIGNLRSDIESIEGRLKYLSNRVSMGTLDVTYYQQTAAPDGFGSKFSSALKGGWSSLILFLLGLTYLWPFLLIIGVVVFFVLRRMRKGKNRPDAST